MAEARIVLDMRPVWAQMPVIKALGPAAAVAVLAVTAAIPFAAMPGAVAAAGPAPLAPLAEPGLDALHDASAFEASLPDVVVPVEPTARLASSTGISAVEAADMGNLIDFEVLDFTPPDDGEIPPGKGAQSTQ